MSRTGRCLCGAVQFEAEGVSDEVHACHCNMCRHWSGGPGLAVQAESVRFTGEEHLARYASSGWAERGFCTRCGSNLFYRLKEPDVYTMWFGAFDDPTPYALHGEIYVDEKPAAYDFAGDHPRMTGAEFLASLGMAGDDGGGAD